MERISPEQVGFSSERLTRIDTVMQNYVDRNEVAGLSTLIARHGKVVHTGYYGQADMAARRPITSETIYRFYSMTKPITAAAALVLYERGLYTLYDSISDYIPSFKSMRVLAQTGGDTGETVDAERQITIKDLFTHTAGLSYGFTDSPLDKLYNRTLRPLYDPRRQVNTEGFIDVIAGLPLAYQPGAAMRYSYAIDVLGRLVEVLSGKRFGQFLQEEMFEPLGMTDTAFHVPEAKSERLAELYDVDGKDGPKPSQSAFRRGVGAPLFESGGGGLLGTLGDYARFAQMLCNGGELDGVQLLSPSTIKLMSQNHLNEPQMADFRLMNKRGYGYGLGVRTMVDLASAATAGSLGEFGWDGAASTWCCVDPTEDLIAVHMIQMMPFGYYPIMLRFQALVYQALVESNK